MYPVSPLQAMMDGMSAGWQRERAESQMTLGGLIEALKALPPDTPVRGFGEPHSYRGYYSDLSFEPTQTEEPAVSLLMRARACMGMVFTGYKGGDFQMGERTPLFMAPYGGCGPRLMSLNTGSSPVTPVTKEED